MSWKKICCCSTLTLLGYCTASASEKQLENGSFTAELDGFPIHYEVHGEGPVLMTVPNAWGLSLEGLRGMYAPLEDHVTMVYFDPRGMGGSGAIREEADRGAAAVRADFEALRQHLGLDQVHAIGWSNGATNLILLASEHPDAIESAIFLHGVASFTPEDARFMIQRYPELFQAFAAFEKEMADSDLSDEDRNERVRSFDVEIWFPQMMADPETGRERLAEAFGAADFSWAHAQHANQEWSTIDVRAELSQIRARSLVIAGSHDALPPEKGREIASGIPEARFVLFEDSGHFAPLEEPEKFSSTVLEFLGVDP